MKSVVSIGTLLFAVSATIDIKDIRYVGLSKQISAHSESKCGNGQIDADEECDFGYASSSTWWKNGCKDTCEARYGWDCTNHLTDSDLPCYFGGEVDDE